MDFVPYFALSIINVLTLLLNQQHCVFGTRYRFFPFFVLSVINRFCFVLRLAASLISYSVSVFPVFSHFCYNCPYIALKSATSPSLHLVQASNHIPSVQIHVIKFTMFAYFLDGVQNCVRN